MQLLATGLSGFVGSHCAQQLGAVDLLHEGRLADLRDRAEVAAAVGRIRPDAVIHLAAQSSVAVSIEDPALTHQVNVEGTLNLLLALEAAGFHGRMLYIGSGDAYGAVPEGQLPITEAHPFEPLNPYARSKAEAEALCREWSRRGPFEIVMARPFNHIGPGQSTQFAVADFARQIVACRDGKGPARLSVGDIDTTRDFTDVRDIVRAYGMLLQSGRNGEAYNVCSGVERSLREIIAELCGICGVRVDIEVNPLRLRPSEQRRMYGSFAKLDADTGWSPAVPFVQTLQDIVEYWHLKDST